MTKISEIADEEQGDASEDKGWAGTGNVSWLAMTFILLGVRLPLYSTAINKQKYDLRSLLTVLTRITGLKGELCLAAAQPTNLA